MRKNKLSVDINSDESDHFSRKTPNAKSTQNRKTQVFGKSTDSELLEPSRGLKAHFKS